MVSTSSTSGGDVDRACTSTDLGHEPRPDGQVGVSCLSQWWPAGFDADGHEVGSDEHYIMRRKATLFGDATRAKAILQTRSPSRAKVIGRAVEGFDEAIWTERRCAKPRPVAGQGSAR